MGCKRRFDWRLYLLLIARLLVEIPDYIRATYNCVKCARCRVCYGKFPRQFFDFPDFLPVCRCCKAAAAARVVN
jgi:hypothetical protein